MCIKICVDAGTPEFVCQVCNKRFHRRDLLGRHEERHRNKNKKDISPRGYSLPLRIVPAPSSVPTLNSDLSNKMPCSITIPVSAPESEVNDLDPDLSSSPSL